MVVKQETKKEKKQGGEKGNSREREKKKKTKLVRQNIAKADNEIHRRSQRRKASLKEKKIIDNLKNAINSNRLTNAELRSKKEEWLDELRLEKVKLNKMQIRGKRIRNNTLFRENQRTLFEDDNERKGELSEMEKFVEFWGSIWEKKEQTPEEPWMEKIAEELRIKVKEVADVELRLNALKKTIQHLG